MILKETEIWWDIFHRASALRDRVREVKKKPSYTKKYGTIQAIKRDAFNLLNESGIPQPLRMLIVELWGGPQSVIERYPWPPEKLAAAFIEANQPEKIGYKRLTTLLKKQTGKSIDPARVRAWQRDSEYRYFINVRRDIPKSELELKKIRQKARSDIEQAKKELKKLLSS